MTTEPRRGLLVDFGGVLTAPLSDAFAAMQEGSDITLEELGLAMLSVAQRDGANPLFELETGRLSERDFLARLGAVRRQLGGAGDARPGRQCLLGGEARLDHVRAEHVGERDRVRGRRHVVRRDVADRPDRVEDHRELGGEPVEFRFGQVDPREVGKVRHLVAGYFGSPAWRAGWSGAVWHACGLLGFEDDPS